MNRTASSAILVQKFATKDAARIGSNRIALMHACVCVPVRLCSTEQQQQQCGAGVGARATSSMLFAANMLQFDAVRLCSNFLFALTFALANCCRSRACVSVHACVCGVFVCVRKVVCVRVCVLFGAACVSVFVHGMRKANVNCLSRLVGHCLVCVPCMYVCVFVSCVCVCACVRRGGVASMSALKFINGDRFAQQFEAAPPA